MAQNDNSWITQLVMSSPIIQAGVAVGATLAVAYAGRKAFNKVFGNTDGDDLEKTKVALDALSKVTDAQARLIELQQARIEGLLDETEPRRGKTQPIPDIKQGDNE